MKFAPHNYQHKAIKFMLERACAGLFLDPGMGKTSITLAAIKVLRSMRLIDKTLIVAPLRVCYSTWPAEIQKWDEFNHLRIEILHGSKKNAKLETDADIYITNPESLPWLVAATAGKPFPFDVLVVDESSKFKNPTAKRSKLLKKLLDKFRRRYILTGSPAPNGLLDLFGQVFIMDQGATLGPYITHYRETFFYPSGFGGYDWKLKEGSEQKIHKLLQPHVMRLAAEDYLELPPLVEVNIPITLPPEAMVKYLAMEKTLKTEVEEGHVTAANAAVATLKCRQIANGGIFTNAEAGEWENIHNAKTEAVVDLVEELEGQPALVAYDFRHDLARLKHAFGKDTPHIGSGVSAKRSNELVQAWNRGDIPVLLGHPSSMAHGLNMQEAGRAVIWHSLTWNLEEREQFIRRVWRQGQQGRVFVYNIIAQNTIDHAIMQVVSQKDKSQKALLGALRDYWAVQNNKI